MNMTHFAILYLQHQLEFMKITRNTSGFCCLPVKNNQKTFCFLFFLLGMIVAYNKVHELVFLFFLFLGMIMMVGCWSFIYLKFYLYKFMFLWRQRWWHTGKRSNVSFCDLFPVLKCITTNWPRLKIIVDQTETDKTSFTTLSLR